MLILYIKMTQENQSFPDNIFGINAKEAYDRVLSSPDVKPKDKEPKQEDKNIGSYNPEKVFILKYDDFGKLLVRKVNERFKGTQVQIPTNLDANQEIPINNLTRSALVTIISKEPELRALGLYPITLLESELLLQGNKLPKDPSTYWEDLALILYDHSDQGANPKEAKALYDSIKEHKNFNLISLTDSGLEQRLLIVNAGLEVDPDFSKGVKPKLIPRVTQIIVHPTLRQTGKDHKFSYGLDHGLPPVQSLGTGNRILLMPSSNENIGLRVLFRYWVLNLYAWIEILVDSSEVGRVTFAKKSA